MVDRRHLLRLGGIEHCNDGNLCPTKFWSQFLPNSDRRDLGVFRGRLPNSCAFWSTSDQGSGTPFTWDANGNPTGAGYSIGADNELASDGTWNYTYDSAGNTITKVGISNNLAWAFTYNNANRVISAVETDTSTQTVLQSVSYVYDVFGNRLSQSVTINGTTTVTNFASTPDGTLYADIDTSGTIQTRYIAGVGGPDTWLARVTSGSHAYWLLSDYQGSITLVVDLTGAGVDAIGYDAWGNITSETSPSERGSLGFQGGWFDPVTGTWIFGIRVYDPCRNQWTTQDPTGLGPDSNPYRFVGNGPTNGTDPSGRHIIVVGEEAKKQVMDLLRNKVGMKGTGSNPVAREIPGSSPTAYVIEPGLNFLRAMESKSGPG